GDPTRPALRPRRPDGLRRAFGACPASPLPGRRELAVPHSPARPTRLHFHTHVVVAVLAIGEGEACADQFGAQVRAAALADGDYAAVVVDVPLLATHRAAANELLELTRRCRSARPAGSAPAAILSGFRRIHAE